MRLRALVAALTLASAAWCAAPGPVDAKAEVYFAPGDNCPEAVIRKIDEAKRSVLVQAYNFSSTAIAQAIVDAHRRGVKVVVILDSSQRTEADSCADFLQRAGVHVRIDSKRVKAHNKIVIIDEEVVLTGSFNFSGPVEERTADNLLVLHSRELAVKYIENWQRHFEQAKRYKVKEQE